MFVFECLLLPFSFGQLHFPEKQFVDIHSFCFIQFEEVVHFEFILRSPLNRFLCAVLQLRVDDQNTLGPSAVRI